MGFSRSLVVIVGIDNYAAGVPPLGNAVRDAMAVQHCLAEEHGYEILSRINEEADGESLIQLLEVELPRRLGSEDRLLFYFAGHGIALPDDHGYLIPYGAELARTDKFLPMQKVQSALMALPCRHMLAILDCCFAGRFPDASSRDILLQPKSIYQERFARFVRDPAWQVLTSAAPNEAALDVIALRDQRGGGAGTHSPFALGLLRGLRGAADENGDGLVTATDLYQHVRAFVEAVAEEMGRRQTPQLRSLSRHERGEYVFRIPGQPLHLAPAPALLAGENPYRGLASFTASDAHQFFGRGRLIAQLLEHVRTRPLTVITGPSGSGKSSLIQAGLLPRLREELKLRIIDPLRPGEDPVRTLLVALGSRERSVPEALRAIHAASAESRLLIVIDQCEEFFTFPDDPSTGERLLQELTEAVGALAPWLHIVLVVRADYTARLKRVLATPIEPFIVGAMTQDELREAIERPAMNHVLFLSPKLVDRLLNEVLPMPGALPLLSFALSEMYLLYLKLDAQDRELTLEHYERVGGVSGALTRRATEEYEALCRRDVRYESAVRNVILRMIGDEGTTRRRVSRAELHYSDPAENRRVNEVLRAFEAARLVVWQGGNGEESFVEPAHDALLSDWDLLKDWRKQAREAIAFLRALAPAAAEWERRDKANGYLWTSTQRLPVLQALLGYGKGLLNAREEAFTRRSLARLRRQRVIIASSVCLLALLMVLATFFWRAAERNAQEARQQLAATHREAGWQRLLNAEPLQSLVWLSAAYREGDRSSALATLLASATQDVRSLALLGHSGPVYHSTFSPDGTMVATAGHDGSVRLFDLQSGQARRVLQRHTKPVNHVAFSADGKRLASAGEDGMAQIWDALHGTLLATCGDHKRSVVYVAFDPTGRSVVTSSQDGTIGLCDTATGRRLRTLQGSEDGVERAVFSWNGTRLLALGSDVRLWNAATFELITTLHDKKDNLHDARFSVDGKWILTAGDDGTVRIWDSTSGRLHREIETGIDGVRIAIFSPDRQYILAAGLDNTARLFRIITGDKLVVWGPHAGYVAQSAFSPDGDLSVTAGLDGKLMLWHVHTHGLLAAVDAHTALINSIEFSPDGAMLVTAGQDGIARLFRLGHERVRRVLAAKLRKSLAAFPEQLAFSQDDSRVMACGQDGVVRLWYTTTGRLNAELRVPGQECSGAAMSADGHWVVVRAELGATVFDASTGNSSASLKGHEEEIETVAFSPDAEQIITSSSDGTARLWSRRNGRLLRLLKHNDKVKSALFHPSGRYVLTTCLDRTARLWDASTGELLRSFENVGNHLHTLSRDGARVLFDIPSGGLRVFETLTGKPLGAFKEHSMLESSAEFSPDGMRVLSGSLDTTAQIWEADTGRRLATLRASHWVGNAAFSHDGTRVVTGDRNGAVTIWDADSGKPLLSLTGHTAGILHVSFNHDGSLVLTGSNDGTARLWDTQPELREPTVVEQLARCYAPQRLEGARLIPIAPPHGCPPPDWSKDRNSVSWLRASNLRDSGWQAMLQGQEELAARRLTEALQIYRELAYPLGERGVLLELATLHARQGHKEEATRFWQQWYGKGGEAPPPADVLRQLGAANLIMSHPQEGMELLEQARALDPEEVTIAIWHLRALFSTGQLAEVLAAAPRLPAVESEGQLMVDALWFAAQRLQQAEPKRHDAADRLLRSYQTLKDGAEPRWSLSAALESLLRGTLRESWPNVVEVASIFSLLDRKVDDETRGQLAKLLAH